MMSDSPDVIVSQISPRCLRAHGMRNEIIEELMLI
jgi:hypothetical protein